MNAIGTSRENLARLIEGEGVTRVAPPLLLPADPYFDLAGEEFGRRLLLTHGEDGVEYCLRPDFTLPIATAYLAGPEAGKPAALGYFGPTFRQRAKGPAEFHQAGLELIGQPDPDQALDRVFAFANTALSAFSVQNATLKLGSVALFEALLARVEMPKVWRPRIRHRFGHPEALARLIDRLSDPHGEISSELPLQRPALVAAITGKMQAEGFDTNASRRPEEIADRYLEKQALAAARVSDQTIAILRDFLAIAGPLEDALARLEALTTGAGIDVAAPLANLRRHAAAQAQSGGFGATIFDAGFSPRLDYYTGLVFEISGADHAVLVSGGQYDRLLERLGADGPIAASGCSLWVERLEAEAL